MKNSSTLSHKLFVRIAPTIVIAILTVGAFAFHSANKEINKVYDAQLQSNANVLWMLISDELGENENGKAKIVNDMDFSLPNQTSMNDSADDYADSRMFRIWKSGGIIMYSDNSLPKSISKQPDGYSTILSNKEYWRIYSLPIKDKQISIEVGEKVALRDTLVHNILLNLEAPLIALIVVVALLLWFGIRNGLGTIHNLVDHIRKRSPNDLSHLDFIEMPKDLLPLGKSLNQLFTQLENSFTAEKRFTDHAAHQLRTPLATLKLQLQMLANANSESERKSLIRELMQSNERAIKLVTMLLTVARLDHQEITLQPVNLYQTIASAMAETGLLAKEKNIEMSLDGPEKIKVLADEALLKLMIGNIIENGVKYTPKSGFVRVKIESQEKYCKIFVVDSGAGIPEEERKLVFGRFYRVSTPQSDGSGLGLTIVSEIIERFAGTIELKTPESGSGLLVEITLPSA